VGLLGELIGAELDKKKEERQFQMKAYYDALASGQVKPGQQEAAWDLFKKQVPKDAHGIVDNIIKPLTMLKNRQRQVGDEAGPKKFGGGSASPGDAEAQSPLYSQDEMEQQKLAREKQEAQQKAAIEIETATKKAQAVAAANRQTQLQSRKEDGEEVSRTLKNPNLSEEEKVSRITAITGRPPERRAWKTGVIRSLDGKANLVVSYNEKEPSKVMMADGQLINVPPTMTPPIPYADYEREQKEADAAKKGPPDPAELREETEYWKSQGLGDKEARDKALAGIHGKHETSADLAKTRLGEAREDKNAASAPAANNPASVRSAALFELVTGDKPSYGLGKSAERTAYNNERNKLLQDLGPTQVGAMRAAFRSGSAELTQLMKATGMLDSVESAFQYDIKNAKQASEAVPRTDIRRYNTYRQFVSANLENNPKLAQLRIAAQTAANQYARIMVSAGRGSVTTDSARSHAEELLNGAMAQGTFDAALDQMDKEAQNMTRGLNEATQKTQGNLQRLGQPTGASPSQNTPVAVPSVSSADDYNKLKSGDTYTDPQGNVRKKP
jgi:hypothetical protein